jgi:catechol 2,3-dioxygenase-like lactoylglutathione lyase family enzyme
MSDETPQPSPTTGVPAISPRFAAIGVVVSDLARTIAFYRRLGCAFDDAAPGQGHVETTIGGLRLMFDTEEEIRSFNPDWNADGSGRVALAAECASPADVDRLHDELSGLGSGSKLAPFDGFWGQRYATVLDPDGVLVDLFASLRGAPES